MADREIHQAQVELRTSQRQESNLETKLIDADEVLFKCTRCSVKFTSC